MEPESMFPSNEQMMADLDGKIPDWQMQTLKDGLAFIERNELLQIARMIESFPPIGGTFTILKPPRYVVKVVDKAD